MLRTPRVGHSVVGLIWLVALTLTPWMLVQAAPRATAADLPALSGGVAPAGLSARDWNTLQALLPADLRQDAYLKASNTDEGDNFGWSVAIVGGHGGRRSVWRGQRGDRGERETERQLGTGCRGGVRVRARWHDLVTTSLPESLQHRRE